MWAILVFVFFSNLQAARIDGFPGVITALGTLRIRGDLLVASLSRSELAEALRSYAEALNVLPSNPASRNSSGLSLLTKLHLQSSSTPEEETEMPTATNTTTTVAAPTDTGPVNFTTNETVSSLPNASTVPLPPPPPPPHQKSRSSLEVGEVFQTQPPPPLLPGGQKFVVSRLFLFDRMLLVTEEVKAKRKGTSADAFAQSTYQFRAAVNVNKMKFEVSCRLCLSRKANQLTRFSTFRCAHVCMVSLCFVAIFSFTVSIDYVLFWSASAPTARRLTAFKNTYSYC